MTRSEDLLPTSVEVQKALGRAVMMEEAERAGSLPPVGDVIKSAAVDTAFRRFLGTLDADGATLPVAVSVMALVFGSVERAGHIFAQVAGAAHLKAEVDGCTVAVETAAGPSGLVSYWGFLHRADTIAVVTLDSLDPQRLSVADLRSLVRVVAARLEAGEM